MNPADVPDKMLLAALAGYYGRPTTADEADPDVVDGLRAGLAAGMTVAPGQESTER
jgi:hypothetical protein